MKMERLPPVKTSLEPSNHPYLNGAWTPLARGGQRHRPGGDLRAHDPHRYRRRSICATPRTRCSSRSAAYHPFDGDGMIHHDRASRTARPDYRNRFVRTRGFEAEQEAEPVRCGAVSMDPVRAWRKRPGWGAHGALKDSSSTDVVVHAGKIALDLLPVRRGLPPRSPETLEQERARQLGCRIDGDQRPIPRSTRRPASCCSSTTPSTPPTCTTASSIGPGNRLATLCADPAAGPAPAARHGLHGQLLDPQRPAGVLGRQSCWSATSTRCG
jgi:hypothetical protein